MGVFVRTFVFVPLRQLSFVVDYCNVLNVVCLAASLKLVNVLIIIAQSDFTVVFARS